MQTIQAVQEGRVFDSQIQGPTRPTSHANHTDPASFSGQVVVANGTKVVMAAPTHSPDIKLYAVA